MTPSAITTNCYVAGDFHPTLLRFESPRECIALPYATLLASSLSVDETVLELDFAAHRVTINGERLHEIFCSVAAGLTHMITSVSVGDQMKASSDTKAPLVREIRVKALEVAN